jgi:hypothetical protein
VNGALAYANQATPVIRALLQNADTVPMNLDLKQNIQQNEFLSPVGVTIVSIPLSVTPPFRSVIRGSSLEHASKRSQSSDGNTIWPDAVNRGALGYQH